MNLIVEVSAGAHSHIQRLNLGQGNVRLGRGWDMDVILQDKYIDPAHMELSLDADGQLLLSDLDSQNGSRVAGKQLHGTQVYQAGDRIRLGETVLRIYHADSDVAPATTLSIWQRAREKVTGRGALVLLTVAAIGTSVAQAWLSSRVPVDASDLMGTAAAVVMALLVWALFFALISKMVRGNAQIKTHWAFACLIIIGQLILSVGQDIMRFNLQSVTVSEIISSTLNSGLIFLIVYGILSYCTFFARGTKTLASSIAVVGLLLSQYSDAIFAEPHERWSYSTQNESITLPPSFLLRSPVSLDEYHQQLPDIFEAADRNATK